jgi:hypothetical protein
MTTPNAKAKFFLLNKLDTSAACAVIKLYEHIPNSNLPININV